VVDKQAHITALQQLAEMLSDAVKLQEIRSAPNNSSLLKILTGSV
jgi:mannitol/fructose-specific phosphotransferase system IIA component (Ntr-type)